MVNLPGSCRFYIDFGKNNCQPVAGFQRVFTADMIILTLMAAAVITLPADTASLDSQISSLWNSLSHEPQSKPDISKLQQLFADNAIVAGLRQKDGKPSLSLQPAADFITSQNRVNPNGFYECETAREIRVTDGFATVLSLVESRRNPTQQQADFTGINSMQWSNAGKGWQLVSLYYYLPASGQSDTLLSGISGQCINQNASPAD